MSLWLSAPLTTLVALWAPETAPTPDPIPDPIPIVPVADATAPTPSDPAPTAETQPPGDQTVHPTADPADPATEPSAEPTAEPKPEPEIANLLTSDEPEATPSERPIAATRPDPRVDRGERMRSYYAATYRPKSNPARVWFAARGAYSLTGNNASTGGGRMGVGVVEVGQTWNWLGYGIGGTIMAGGLTFGADGVAKSSNVVVGGGPSLGLGRLALLGRGFVDFRVGYNFFYAPVRANLAGMADPIDASPHGPKVQLDIGLLLHDSETRRFRHGLGATLGWQMLVHTFTGEYPRLNSFNVGIGYFFG